MFDKYIVLKSYGLYMNLKCAMILTIRLDLAIKYKTKM